MSASEILTILLFGYPPAPEMIDPRYPAFLQQIGGLCLTLSITASSLVLGTPLGLLLAICRADPRRDSSRQSHVRRMARGAIRAPADVLVQTVRGIPVMILVLLVFYLPYRVGAVRVPPAILAIAAFSLYAGVYLSETIRSGFGAVDPGWLDAARVLGLSRSQILLRIQLPIALRVMVPAMLGQAITVFKDTSVLTVVAVGELTFSARQIHVSQPANYAVVLLLVLLIYWTVATAGSALLYCLESSWRKRVSD